MDATRAATTAVTMVSTTVAYLDERMVASKAESTVVRTEKRMAAKMAVRLVVDLAAY